MSDRIKVELERQFASEEDMHAHRYAIIQWLNDQGFLSQRGIGFEALPCFKGSHFHYIYSFKDPKAAILFKLTWGGA